jgi:hypothetical protein
MPARRIPAAASRPAPQTLLVASARQVGRRLGWAADLRALLSGRAVREAEPETLALERALAELERRKAVAVVGEMSELSIAVSHDGVGRARGVTVTVSALGRTQQAPGRSRRHLQAR